jgi:hypothetical protein
LEAPGYSPLTLTVERCEPMRDREKNTYHPTITRWWQILNATTGAVVGAGSDGPHPGPNATHFHIFDQPWSSDARVKPVWHVKSKSVFRQAHQGYYGNGNVHVVYGPGSYLVGFGAVQAAVEVPFSSHLLPMDLSFGDSEFQNWIYQSVQNAQESWQQVPTSFSLGNSIIELRDLVRLGQQAVSLARWLRQVGSRWRRNVDGTVNAFLAVNFGLLPTVSDIQALARSIYAIARRLRFLRDTRGRHVTLRHKSSYTYSNPAPAGWGGTTSTWIRTRTTYTLVLGCRLFHTLEGLDDVSAWVRAFGAFAGFNQPLSIAWNAIPYSFLVDWLYNVGNHLSSIRIPTFEGTYRISDKWSSLSATSTVEFTHWPEPWDLRNHPFVFGRWDVKHYTRSAGLPTVSDPLGVLSWMQLLLSGALFVQGVNGLVPR